MHSRSEGDGVLLVDALREKYCPEEEEEDPITGQRTGVEIRGEIREFARKSRPGGGTSPTRRACVFTFPSPPGFIPVQSLLAVVLERSGITHSGPRHELASLCPSVQRLSLGGNCISSWDAVSESVHSGITGITLLLFQVADNENYYTLIFIK